jgi:hypothetical protein
MKLVTEEQKERLIDNGRYNAIRRSRGEFEIDYMPVVKIFCPWGGATEHAWLAI